MTVQEKEHLWYKCSECSFTSSIEEYENDYYKSCPHCGNCDKISAQERIQLLLDAGSFMETNQNILSVDKINFFDGDVQYAVKLESSRKNTKLSDAVVTGKGTINSIPVNIAVMDFSFMGGSMGAVVGEKITRAIENATKEKTPVIIICASGGARMQEGVLSLMQMAKTSAALERHAEAGLSYISILTHPTTGGVTASFAMLGDVIIAEPKALIGFAGPRVISQTIGQKLPEGFQRAEFLQDHGFVDIVVKRLEMKQMLAKLIHYMS